MAQGHISCQEIKYASAAEVVCFGMIASAVGRVVDELPEHNCGLRAKAVQELISDDAAILATLLRSWDVRSGLMGAELGDADAGRKVVGPQAFPLDDMDQLAAQGKIERAALVRR